MTTFAIPTTESDSDTEFKFPEVCKAFFQYDPSKHCNKIATIETIVNCPGDHVRTVHWCEEHYLKTTGDVMWCALCNFQHSLYVVVSRPI